MSLGRWHTGGEGANTKKQKPNACLILLFLACQLVYTSGASVFRGPGSGYGCGWDVVLPHTWARELWHALVLAGARTCGLSDIRQHAIEKVAASRVSVCLCVCVCLLASEVA